MHIFPALSLRIFAAAQLHPDLWIMDNEPLIDWGFNTTLNLGQLREELHGLSLIHGWGSAEMGRRGGRPSFTWDRILLYYKLQEVHPLHASNLALYFNVSYTQTPDAFHLPRGPLQVSFSNAVFCHLDSSRLMAVGMCEIDGFNSGKLLGCAFGTQTIKPENADRAEDPSRRQQGDHRHTGRHGPHLQHSPGGFYPPRSQGGDPIHRGLPTPRLLMVSGIGCCDELAEFDIPCIGDLPGVGKNLQDPVMFGTSHRIHLETASTPANNQTAAALNMTVPSDRNLPEPYRSQLSQPARDALWDFPDHWPEIKWLP
ncbi:hypothetical protein EYZ11_003585 [Aspergillus tanneri]|uniref:Uncharacterized protein n=1 Tax=Aspergillus tanneri TaxID=1220188 RepID=A0A4V3UPY3_9EURO|nr:hypothetical protein EYZ11_003585 [Aspergillus tanneri]